MVNLYRFRTRLIPRSSIRHALIGKSSGWVKLASSAGYRQWHYGRQIPRRHLVTSASDLSDLEARAIGVAACALTPSMTWKNEMATTRHIVSTALLSASENPH